MQSDMCAVRAGGSGLYAIFRVLFGQALEKERPMKLCEYIALYPSPTKIDK